MFLDIKFLVRDSQSKPTPMYQNCWTTASPHAVTRLCCLRYRREHLSLKLPPLGYIHVHDRGALYYYACAFHLDGQGMFPPPPPISCHAQLASCHGTTSETSLSLCGWVERDDEGDGDWRYGSGGQSSGGSHSHRPQTKWRVGVPLLQGWRPKVRKTNYYLNLVQIHHSCEWAGMLNLDY